MENVSDLNVAEQVLEELRSAIQSGELVPGERLIERKIAAQLGVSHIPVREALARLTQERLVVREPRRGARVAGLTAVDLEEVSSLRILLEQFMAIRIQERWSPEAAARLNSIVEAMAAAPLGDVGELLRQDRLFHEALGELAEHRLLTEINTQLRGRISGFIHAANAALTLEEQEAHVQSHQVIVDAIASGDPERARTVIEEHMTQALQRIVPFAEPSDQGVTSTASSAV